GGPARVLPVQRPPAEAAARRVPADRGLRVPPLRRARAGPAPALPRTQVLAPPVRDRHPGAHPDPRRAAGRLRGQAQRHVAGRRGPRVSPPPGADAGRRRPDAFPLPLCIAVPVGVDPEAARALLAALPASHGVILLEAEGREPVQLAATADLRAFAVQRLVEREGPRADLLADLLEVTRAVRACPCGSAIEADLLLLELARERRPETAREIAERTQPWFLAIDPGAEHPV